ncbi:MAG: hypothetical protein ACM3OC_00590 [Deltaproteobacteria bacterium]
MKRLVIIAAGVCFVLTSGTQAHAWFGKKKQQDGQETAQSAPVPQQAAPKKDQKVSKDEKAKLEAIAQQKQTADKKRQEIENTEWQIELTPLNGKGKKEAETIVFSASQVKLVGYGKKGFPSTNYTLSVQDSGLVIWETMQTSEKAGITFLRGEMPDMQTMRGILSYHPDPKTTEDYSFISTMKKVIPAPAEPVAAK